VLLNAKIAFSKKTFFCQIAAKVFAQL